MSVIIILHPKDLAYLLQAEIVAIGVITHYTT